MPPGVLGEGIPQRLAHSDLKADCLERIRQALEKPVAVLGKCVGGFFDAARRAELARADKAMPLKARKKCPYGIGQARVCLPDIPPHPPRRHGELRPGRVPALLRSSL